MGRIACRFGRVEPRRRAEDLVLGLLSDLPVKICWTIAEYVGDAMPDGLQHLLARAVLVVDETGEVEKGTHTVGVQRQYTGTAGRIENSQVAVYLTYAAGKGHAVIDRALYLPKSWAEYPERRAAVGMPDEVEFARKPALAHEMITRALDADVGARWLAGDEVYGADPGLRGKRLLLCFTTRPARRIGHPEDREWPDGIWKCLPAVTILGVV